jgi:HlyD family secretion protein
MTLADMSVITAEVKVDETDIVSVALGQPVEVSVDALPGKIFKGHVTEVGDQALLRSTGVATSQTTSGTEEAKDFKVVVTIDEVAGQNNDELRPGLSSTAKITTARKPNALTIPIQALTLYTPPAVDSKGHVTTVAASSGPVVAPKPQQGVFVLRKEKGKLRAVFVPVTTGITGATEIEVTSGLQAGDEIVTGTYRVLRSLKDGDPVKIDTTPAVVKDTDSSSS